MNRVTVIVLGGLISIGMVAVPALAYTNHQDSIPAVMGYLAPVLLLLVKALVDEHRSNEIERKVDEVRHNTNGALSQRLDQQTHEIVRKVKTPDPAGASKASGAIVMDDHPEP